MTGELAARGHRVLVIAPSQSPAWCATPAALGARDDRTSLLPGPASRRVLGVGEVLPSARRAGARPRCPSTSRARSRTLLTALPLDVCHVHEPFAPSASSAALRHSRALNVGTFHAPTERLLSTQVAREARRGCCSAASTPAPRATRATRELMQRFFPADYSVVLPGADAAAQRVDPRTATPSTLVFVDDEERGGAAAVPARAARA